MVQDKWTPQVCKDNHWWIKICFAVVIGALSLLGTAMGVSLNMSRVAADKADAVQLIADRAMELVAKDLAVEKKESQDHWEANLRQFSGVRDSMRELKDMMEKSEKQIVEESKENRKLLIEVLQGQKKNQ